MQKKIIAVFMAVLLAVSCLSVNALAFDFGGSDRTRQEAFADWFKSLQEFAKDPVNKADDMVKANHRFNTDMVALGYEDNLDIINGITSGFVPGYDKLSDDAINQITGLLNSYGIDTPKQQFEDWYREKYGKEYYKRDFPIENLKKNNYQYYIKSDCGRYYKWVFFNSTRTVFDVKDFNNSGHKFIYVIDTTDGYYVTKYKDGSTTYHGEYDCNGGYYGLDVNPNQYSSGKVLDHNLPLNYWGDILEPSGNIDDIFDEFGEGEGEGLTPDEFDDFLNDLLNDLKNSMPDLTTVEGILQAIYRKCCEISSKIGKQATNVYKQTLQGIQTSLDKIASFCGDFWNKFADALQSLFVPSDSYLQDSLEDIQDEFSLKFAFAESLKKILTKCFDVYKAGGSKAPNVTFRITGLGFLNSIISHTIDLSDWDEYVKPIRAMVCVITYATFAWNTYRRIPAYVSGVGEQ